jgi:hypothetical protein
MTIYAKRPGTDSLVCIRIPVEGFDISIACDDSCGAMKDLGRSSLRVYSSSGDDYTGAVFNVPDLATVDATIENLEQAIAFCKGGWKK